MNNQKKHYILIIDDSHQIRYLLKLRLEHRGFEIIEAEQGTQTTTLVYDDHIARQFAVATIVWGIVGMLLGIIIALQLAFWPANFGLIASGLLPSAP